MGAIYARQRTHLGRLTVDRLLNLDNRRGLGDSLAEDVSLEEIRQPRVQLIADKVLGGDREDLCEGKSVGAKVWDYAGFTYDPILPE